MFCSLLLSNLYFRGCMYIRHLSSTIVTMVNNSSFNYVTNLFFQFSYFFYHFNPFISHFDFFLVWVVFNFNSLFPLMLLLLTLLWLTLLEPVHYGFVDPGIGNCTLLIQNSFNTIIQKMADRYLHHIIIILLYLQCY